MVRQGCGAEPGTRPNVWAATGSAATSVKPARMMTGRTDRLQPAEYAPAIGESYRFMVTRSLKRGTALLGRDALDELDHGALDAAWRDAREGAQQPQRIGCVEETEDGAGILRAGIGGAEEERDRHIQRL